MLVFDEVVNKGSFTLAAESLGHTKSAISHYITQLETALNTKLLNRSTRTLNLTAVGVLLAKRSTQLVDLLTDTLHELDTYNNEPAGRITITAPHAFEANLITPIIAGLCDEYSKLTPELIYTDERLDLLNNKLDLAISVGPQKDSNYNAILIGKLDSILVASPQYIAKSDLITDENLTLQSLISLPWQSKSHLRNQKSDTLEFNSDTLIKVNTSTSAISSIKCGLGIGLIPSVFIKEELDSGQLQQVLPEYKGEVRNVYAIHSYQNRLPLVLRKFVDKLKKNFIKKHY
ncbi:LysR family transcriptional regulator [Pseudoalteromonas sp. NBT06-2]|nr:LysR family transcriptional regulator [Pseudoalteromonas sp. NBT06-2]